MAFQFGLNWAPFSESVGDFFGTVLGFESTMAFMLEASFLGISTPAFSEQARSQLFTAPLVYIFGAIPILGLVLIGLLLGSLKRREENAPLIWTFLIFALSFIFN